MVGIYKPRFSWLRAQHSTTELRHYPRIVSAAVGAPFEWKSRAHGDYLLCKAAVVFPYLPGNSESVESITLHRSCIGVMKNTTCNTDNKQLILQAMQLVTSATQTRKTFK